MSDKQGLEHPDWRALRRDVEKRKRLAVINRRAPRAYLAILGIGLGQWFFFFCQFPMTTAHVIYWSWIAGGFYGFMSGIWPVKIHLPRGPFSRAFGAGMGWIMAIFAWHQIRRMLQPYKHAGHHSPM